VAIARAGVLRAGSLVAICVAMVVVGFASASAGPPYKEVPGSPFPGGAVRSWSVAINRPGTLLATAHYSANSLTMFGLDPVSGALNTLGTTNLGSGSGPIAVAFGTSATETFLAVANTFSGKVVLYSVSASGALTKITTSASVTGSVTAIAFNPAGTLLAVATGVGSVLIYPVSATGLGASKSTSLSASISSLAFSPDGSLLGAALPNVSKVAIVSVAADGTMTQDGKTDTGKYPTAVTFNPTGGMLAVANYSDSTVSMFSVNDGTGALTALGSPTPTGQGPIGVAFDPTGRLLAIPNFNDSTLSLFAVTAQTGGLTQVSGSPLPTGAGTEPDAVAFSRNGLLAAPDWDGGGISMFALSPPTAQIQIAGHGGRVYRRGARVPTRFGCADSTFAPGISSCTDSNGASAPAGHLATASLGVHTYTVTARSKDGQTAHATITYYVAAPPSASITAPRTGRTYQLNAFVRTTFSCREGAGGPGISSCTDSNGTRSPHGQLDTAGFGVGTYTVSATSADGLSEATSISYRVAAPPATAVTSPTPGAHYKLGQHVLARYSCSEGLGGPGIESCRGSVSSGKRIDTAKRGKHEFKLSALSKDGMSASESVTYWVR